MCTGALMAGRAVTAQPEGDDLSAVFRAIDHATPGDVIVVASMDGEARAMWGENASRFAMQRGAIGAILGVPCRDVAAHERLAFPVFAVGATPQAGYFRHGGSVDVPVTVGGTLVHPGDYVIGDENGVVVIPPDLLTEVLEGAPRILEQDRVTQAAILEGKSIPLR